MKPRIRRDDIGTCNHLFFFFGLSGEHGLPCFSFCFSAQEDLMSLALLTSLHQLRPSPFQTYSSYTELRLFPISKQIRLLFHLFEHSPGLLYLGNFFACSELSRDINTSKKSVPSILHSLQFSSGDQL